MSKYQRIEKYITQKGLCTGCGLCASLISSNKVKMEMKSSGFYRPNFSRDLSDKEWEEIVQVCPAINMAYDTYSEDKLPLYGESQDVWIGWASDDKIRFRGSSGGGLTAFLTYLLKEDKVDGILHIGRKEGPFIAKGVLSTTLEEVSENIGSLYMPALVFDNLIEILESLNRIAIVGKGCDIRGLRRFLQRYPKYQSKVILTMSILCGGLPSISGTKQIIKEFGFKEEDVETFRYRGYGWPGFCKAICRDGQEGQMTYNDAWAKRLGPTSPLACKVCFDGIGEAADLVFGDAWKCIDGNYPSFEETDGRNLLIARSKLASQMVLEASKKGYLSLEEEKVDSHLFNIMQPSQSNRRYLAKLKLLGLRVIGYRYPRVNWKYLNQLQENAPASLNLIQKLRTMLGSIKRAYRAKEVR